MNINIRKEEAKDYRRVEELARDSFWNLYFPGCHEHYLVHRMREHKDFIKDLALVIEVDNEIVGAIFYTHSKIVSEDKSEFKTISFGPVFISPDYHRKGLGRKLITRSIDMAKEIGYKAVVILGYPYHYEPYGFLGGKKYNVSMADGKFYKGLLVLPLHEGALDKVSGHIVFSDVFEFSAEEAEDFDKTFPYKEKRHEKSQDEYEATASMLDE